MKLAKDELIKLELLSEEFVINGLRVGQSYMNALYKINPSLYDEITGTDIDPFYNDYNLEGFLDFLS